MGKKECNKVTGMPKCVAMGYNKKTKTCKLYRKCTKLKKSKGEITFIKRTYSPRAKTFHKVNKKICKGTPYTSPKGEKLGFKDISLQKCARNCFSNMWSGNKKVPATRRCGAFAYYRKTKYCDLFSNCKKGVKPEAGAITFVKSRAYIRGVGRRGRRGRGRRGYGRMRRMRRMRRGLRRRGRGRRGRKRRRRGGYGGRRLLKTGEGTEDATSALLKSGEQGADEEAESDDVEDGEDNKDGDKDADADEEGDEDGDADEDAEDQKEDEEAEKDEDMQGDADSEDEVSKDDDEDDDEEEDEDEDGDEDEEYDEVSADDVVSEDDEPEKLVEDDKEESM